MWWFLIALALLLLTILFSYNTIIEKRNQAENAFSSIDVMLKKRYDLIPNLTEAVKGYMQYEAELLKEITKKRAEIMQNQPEANLAVTLDNELTRLISRIMAVVENYPNLKASENFMHLQRSLNEIEEQISAARRAYNAGVTDYNNAIETFPGNLIAPLMKCQRKQLFIVPDNEKQIKTPEFN